MRIHETPSQCSTHSGIRRLTTWPDRGARLALLGLALYMLATSAFVGLRPEHVALAVVYLALIVMGGRALSFLGHFLPVILTGVSYDLSRLSLGLRGEIHVADVYQAELALFGSGGDGAPKIPAEVALEHVHPAADLICGASYLIYLYVPVALAVALFFVDREHMLRVGLAFLFTNLIGLVIYLVYPVAPPWYVFEHGLGPAALDAAPQAAGAARFDALVGIDYFANFYARSANVFGAMPSLHVAFPASSAFALSTMGKRWWIPTALFTALVAYSAVYLQHHYVLDLLAGVACAALGYALARLALFVARQSTNWRHHAQRSVA